MAPRVGLDQAAVMQAAIALADRAGVEEVTLATLAAQLGVRTPTLYHYVEGLTGLRRELALLGNRELATRMGRAVMGKAGDDALIALANAYRDFVKEHPGLYAATLRASDASDTELHAAQQEIVEIVLRVLAFYQLHDDEALHTVRMFRSVVHGFASLEVANGFGLSLEVDETFRRLIHMFLHSLSKPKS